MFRCHVCVKTESRQELVSEVFDIEGKPVPVFSRDTTERVRCMVYGEAKPITSIQMDVFAY